MSLRSLKYFFTLLLVLAQLAATTGYTAMIHYCRMGMPAADAAAAACCCVEESAPEVEPAQACCCVEESTPEVEPAQVCCHAGSAQKAAAAESTAGECATHNSTAAEGATEANTAAAAATRHTTPEAEPAAAGLPQSGLDRAPCCEFVSHFHQVDETAPLAPSMPTLVPAYFMMIRPPDRQAPHFTVAAFASAPPDFQHTLPLLI